MADDNNFFSIHNARLSLVLVGFGSAAFVVTIYHCVTMGWWHQFRNNRGQSSQQTQEVQRQHRASGHEMLDISSLEVSTAELIPAHKYQKGTGLVNDDGMCAVCLSQFEEGEELRTLPECLHSYHSPCIDMWLYSHSSCPMCRTDATPSPHISIRPLDSEPVRLDTRMLYNTIQYSRAI